MTQSSSPVHVSRVRGGSTGASTGLGRRAFEIPATTFSFEGWAGAYLSAVSEQWLKVAPLSNPAMLGMFADRDRAPRRELLPWSGEFAGKYLTSAVQVYRLTHDSALRRVIEQFVHQFIALQDDDGYLGPWPQGSRLTNRAPNVLFGDGGSENELAEVKTWDAWGHYHAMLGLLLWFEESGEESALTCARRIGDLLCNLFEDAPLVDLDPEYGGYSTVEMNQAPIHSLCLLYEHTGDERYLRLATKIRDEFAMVAEDGTPLAGDYLNGPLAGKEFFETPRPRWESLHPVMGLAELWAITGDEPSRRAFEAIWWSIVKSDRHNNGGFSSHEKAVGNPYDRGPIETCCTIAWIAMSVEMLRITGNSIVADELELSTFNSVVGMHSPTGRWVTYDTPMDGVRRAAHSVVFQAREGSPELTCCSVYGARGLGMIGDWAVLVDDEGAVLNWYGPGSTTTQVRGRELTLRQETEYPRGEHVRLSVEVDEPFTFSLRLRIPHWSTSTEVHVNGDVVEGVVAGTYLSVDRLWSTGDRIDIVFDFSLQFWVGERECEGSVSLYRGPILLTYDRRFNSVDPVALPTLDSFGLSGTLIEADEWISPIVLLEVLAVDGSTIRLCDFGSAGVDGSPYRSWLDVTSCSTSVFSPSNPRRTAPASVREP